MANWKTYLGMGNVNKKTVNPRKYLLRLIWLSCISACIPVILASAAYHYISMSRMEQYIHAESDASLLLMKDRAERVLQGIEQESLQLAKDPLLSKMIGHPHHPQSLIWHIELLDRLSVAKNMNGFISEIFLYLDAEGLVVSNEYGVIARNEFKHESDIQALMQSGRLSQWARLPSSGKDGYITFARMLPMVGGGEAKAVLAFEIEAASFASFLEADTVVIPRGSELIILNYRELFGTNAEENARKQELAAQLQAIDNIAAAGKNEERFVAPGIDGKPAHYHYTKNIFSRTYVTIVPEHVITSQFRWIGGMTLLILLSFMGIGMILTWITARKAYSPIERLIDYSRSLNAERVPVKENELEYIKATLDQLNKEKHHLSEFMEKIEPSMREKCLQQLLVGQYTNHARLLQDCKNYGINTQFTNVVLIVQAENLHSDKRFLPEERSIVAFALANVMEEILRAQASLQGHVVPYQGAGVAIVQFNSGLDQNHMHERTLEYAHAVSSALKSVLAFDVTVGIGRYYSHIADARVSYKEAQNALQYRIFQDSERILFIEDVESEKKQTILRYPRELEADMIDALDREDASMATEHLRKFADLLRGSQSYVFIHQSYHLLLSSLIASLDKHNVNQMELMEQNLFEQLKTKQTFSEVFGWFEQTVFPLYVCLTRSERESDSETGIQYICKYIRENCGEDLSLVQCAEMIGVSPSYLSRLFKKEMGMNFLEYVVECKVSEAKRLLRETERSISEIALAVGYSERNLNRIFQRHIQLSPGNYRAKYR
ncbi:helix-turn-helix domain-containing protein [Paenibacillus sp.]|uniref:helix-turn-helix domain-containing protein n=1 Tax=Paenibacillus sp. TaxID=58172 RepID=UPI002D565E10|nr:helix-turn-helix domain-containing protein [Paenibacillus sp.]HZG86701.1 helix-turn-helix domain-containing protein [Paenibacillus sp.]